VTAGAAAVATTIALAGLVAWPAGAEGRPLLLAVGMLAALLQAAAVVRAAFSLAAVSAVVLLADYAVAAVISPGARGAVAVAFGSGLLLAAELAAWSVDLARTGAEPAHLVRRRVGTLAALVLGSAAFSVAVMVVSAAQLGDRQGFLMRAAGVAAAVAVVAILAWLSTRSNLRPARSARWLQAGSGWLGHPGGGRRGGDRS
jgi:hypothetical protein